MNTLELVYAKLEISELEISRYIHNACKCLGVPDLQQCKTFMRPLTHGLAHTCSFFMISKLEISQTHESFVFKSTTLDTNPALQHIVNIKSFNKVHIFSPI